MRWIKFMYDKGGDFSERLGLEFGPASRGEGNVAVYQTQPESGFRTFKGAKMFDICEVASPWLVETYTRRLKRIRTPLYSGYELLCLFWCVLAAIATCKLVLQ
jgi:hypothetical protein